MKNILEEVKSKLDEADDQNQKFGKQGSRKHPIITAKKFLK